MDLYFLKTSDASNYLLKITNLAVFLRYVRKVRNLLPLYPSWWYDREILLLPPLAKIEATRARGGLSGNSPTRAAKQQTGSSPVGQPRHGQGDRKRERSFSGLRYAGCILR